MLKLKGEGPGYSKHHQLNYVISQGYVKFSSSEKIRLANIFAKNVRSSYST